MFVSSCSSSLHSLHDIAVKDQLGSSREVRPQPSLGTGRDPGSLGTLVAQAIGASQVTQCPREGGMRSGTPTISYEQPWSSLRWIKLNCDFQAFIPDPKHSVASLSIAGSFSDLDCYLSLFPKCLWENVLWAGDLSVFSLGLIWLSRVQVLRRR